MSEKSELSPQTNIPTVNNTLIALFSSCPIITEKDMKNLESAKNFIVETYSSVPMYRPLAIKLLGVLSNKDHPTNESKLWQCKVEAEVHANELIRDLHDLEKMKVQIEKNEYMLNNVMLDKLAEQHDKKHMEAEINFDMRTLAITISQQKFEFFQLQKRIKYRIDEVHEWKVISEKLLAAGTKAISYSDMLIENYRKLWEEDLKKSEISEEDKKNLSAKLAILKQTIKNQ